MSTLSINEVEFDLSFEGKETTIHEGDIIELHHPNTKRSYLIWHRGSSNVSFIQGKNSTIKIGIPQLDQEKLIIFLSDYAAKCKLKVELVGISIGLVRAKVVAQDTNT